MLDPNTILHRPAAAAALTAAGYPTAASTLATKATRGGGPRFQKFGKFAVYRWGDLLAWAEGRLGPSVTSTAELDASRRTDSAAAQAAV
jgi:hypothetical protein